LVVTKSASPEPVGAGNPIDYSITVNNPMTDTARDLVITDTLPAGVVYQGLTSTKPELTCTETPPGIVCELPELPVGDSVTIDIEVLAPIVSGASETITNTATASAFEHDPNLANNTWSVLTEVVPRAEMSVVEKTSSATNVDAGTEFNYAITVRNDGPSEATGVVIEDVLPAGIEVIGSSGCLNNPLGTGTITCEVADMPANTEVTVTLNVRAPDEGSVDPLTNTATVSANEMENDGGNNDDDANTDIESVADLSIEKTGPANATRDVSFDYNVTVLNSGPSTAENVVVTDNLPSGLRFEDGESSLQCSAAGSVVTCNLGNVAANATENLTIAVTPLVAGDDPLLNRASVSSVTTDRDLNNNESDFVSTSVTVDTGLFISKSASQGTVSHGDTFTYNIDAGNNGPSNATGVTLVDPLPSGVELISVVPSVNSWECDDGQEVRCTPADGILVAGQGASFVVTVEAVEPGTFDNTATLSANEDEVSDGATVTIEPSLDLSLTKTGPSTAKVGTAFGYSLSVANAGPSTATTVRVTDSLPAGLTNVSVGTGSTGWSCSYNAAAHEVICTAAEFGAGATASFTVSVTPEATGTIENQATITATEIDFDRVMDNNSASVPTEVQ
ncbi:MAG TPA: DUF11 domain-containing protein, partial [Candidatus Sulfomarinibacteraceae bacterium]|nr:DUF11 domain-containing protein [Candidatus Sulfomarinibacteraceae bacterium]